MVKKILFFFIILISSVTFSQQKSIDKLNATPNPFSSTTNISFVSSTKQSILINIKNVLGKTVFSKRIEAIKGSNTIPFDRNHLRAGMYIYAIQTNSDFMSKRFVIR